MRNLRSVAMAALLGCATALPAPAFAADPTPAAKEKKDRQLDPNEIICEKQDVLGSRLAKRRVCMTRSEWAEHRRSDRSLVERSQMRGCASQAGC